jgi:hypothetical protein
MARRCLLSKRYNEKHHFVYSIKQKLSILQEATEVKDIRSRAHKYRVQMCQIHSWRKQVNDIKTKALLTLNSKTTHFGCPAEFLDLESSKLVRKVLPVCTNNIMIAQVISVVVTNTLKKGNVQHLSRLVYCFLEQKELVHFTSHLCW